MSDAPDDLAEVQRRVQEIQRRKRHHVRWNMSTDTAELALVALRPRAEDRRSSGKQRRRKRHKRLL